MNQNIYRTKDLAEAAALIVEGQSLIKIEREQGICWFVFDNKNICESLSNKFFFGGLMINAREYSNTMKLLKGRIFS
ncbi:MAG TPA: hypothetical protein VLF93_03205 [Candidatus Saccharimonadales bacterium]|nr:hypothetical protein [Candidatus Saccharimonadales bacterium]